MRSGNEVDDDAGAREPVSDAAGEVREVAPAQDPAGQSGFKVVSEGRSRRVSPLTWAAVVLILLILGAYIKGYLP